METAPAIDSHALRAARQQAGLSQNDLARHLGIASGLTISRWERGEARPRTPQALHALAEALGVTPTSLLVPPDGAPTLRWMRFAAGLGVTDLARATQTSTATIKRWEASGLRSPSEQTVAALARALGAPPGQVRDALQA